MKVYDVHIHSSSVLDSEQLLKQMAEAGVWGGSVFSQHPQCFSGLGRHSAVGRERLSMVLEACKGQEGRLFPVLWIHPDEPDTIDLIAEAAERGIAAFKCICNSFYIGEEKGIRMLEAVARTGKPIFFHSGILWDDSPSSKYNRPLNWEELLDRSSGTIDRLQGLRFSLGHCSWPWYDECIALYGKFLANLRQHPEDNIEMFFDLTPGTPVSYRYDLFRKLLNCGYDVEHNILWGTDCTAEDYNSEWAKKWLGTDNAIMDALNISEGIREHIFQKNYERFLGLPGCEHHVLIPVSSDGRAVSCEQ